MTWYALCMFASYVILDLCVPFSVALLVFLVVMDQLKYCLHAHVGRRVYGATSRC